MSFQSLCFFDFYCRWYVYSLYILCVYKLQHTVTHCKTLQHTATHCSTMQHMTYCIIPSIFILFLFLLWVVRILSVYLACMKTATHCNTLQHTATHCNTLQHIATLSNKSHYFKVYIFVISTMDGMYIFSIL